jgi:hypothetical protein
MFGNVFSINASSLGCGNYGAMKTNRTVRWWRNWSAGFAWVTIMSVVLAGAFLMGRGYGSISSNKAQEQVPGEMIILPALDLGAY